MELPDLPMSYYSPENTLFHDAVCCKGTVCGNLGRMEEADVQVTVTFGTVLGMNSTHQNCRSA
jgi:hypothetical protein